MEREEATSTGSIDPDRQQSRGARAVPPWILAAALILLGSPRPAVAARADDKMVELTKTTIYGAILGGLLGLATALVVDEDSKDDAVKWGVAAGTFGGFVYGAVVMSRGGDDDLSISLDPPRSTANEAPTLGSTSRFDVSPNDGRYGHMFAAPAPATRIGAGFHPPRTSEVGHESLQEESGEEAIRLEALAEEVAAR